MKTVLVTGGAGLIGAECCMLFAKNNWRVVSVDNFLRGRLFGKQADTRRNAEKFFSRNNIEFHEMDFKDQKMDSFISECDALIHCASQPSHPKSIELPELDFNENAFGTFFLLQRVRSINREVPFVFCSTNKVYGDHPNYLEFEKKEKRFEPIEKKYSNGFDESFSVDRCMHTPFGASKLSADIYCQEFAKLYGLKTGIFRLSCVTGVTACAAEQQNWLPFLISKALNREKISIFGHDGFQVRDLLHAGDLAELFLAFVENPVPGEVFNVGGSRSNSVSVLEALDLIREQGIEVNVDFTAPRTADHKWWISDISKVSKRFNWKPKKTVKDIFNELFEELNQQQSNEL